MRETNSTNGRHPPPVRHREIRHTAAARDEGRAMNFEEAVTFALEGEGTESLRLPGP